MVKRKKNPHKIKMAEKLSKDENIQIQDGWQMNKKKKITYKFKMADND